MRGGLFCGFVAKGAGLELGKDCRDAVDVSAATGNVSGFFLLRSRSIAHCSNCSRVMSAVGGAAYKLSLWG